jgi:hypothetical protein
LLLTVTVVEHLGGQWARDETLNLRAHDERRRRVADRQAREVLLRDLLVELS